MKTAKELLQELADADNTVATATGQLKAAKEKYEAVADQLFRLMDEQGTEAIRNAEIGLQVSIGETDTDIIEDWSKFMPFVLRHKLLHMFQRRLSPKAIQEWEAQHEGMKIPGLGKFHKRRLHVTKFTK